MQGGGPVRRGPDGRAGRSGESDPGSPVYEIDHDRRKVGAVRINKGHLSWLEPSYQKGAWRVYKDARYAGAAESLQAFAKGLSQVLVSIAMDDKAAEMLPAAKTLDLRATAWEWILADGHAERLFREVHKAVVVAEVMES